MPPQLEQVKYSSMRNALEDATQYMEQIFSYAVEGAVREIEEKMTKDPSLNQRFITTENLSKAIGSVSMQLDNIFDKTKLSLNGDQTHDRKAIDQLKTDLKEAFKAAFSQIGLTLKFESFGASIMQGSEVGGVFYRTSESETSDGTKIHQYTYSDKPRDWIDPF